MGLFSKKAETAQTAPGSGWINYAWIVRHFGFLLFLATLAVVYIANGHWADDTIRDINITQKQVKDMEYEYKNLKSLEMYRSRESQVTQAAAALGLKPGTTPPVKLSTDSTLKNNNKNIAN
ncbi:FtsL-like putative cell division protein [Parafilimonas sp.]|uniref:FtsL-like putative cell division protein n=1 Tax=Parafilimonas sp. TaxID=1969739 RepID=UPI0039E46665